MRLDLLTALTEENGPFLTVSSDVSRVDVAGAREVELRWEAAVRELTAAGAPPEVVGQVGELVTARTGRSGRVGRLVVATRDRVVLDLVLPEPPPRDHARWGHLPCLLPVFRSLSSTTRYAVARVDRSGADVEVVGLLGQTTQAETVNGTDDVVHKVPGGGWAQRRYQARVEDSWQHNASAVARELDAIVRRDRPQLVLLEGDEQAMTLLQEHAGHELASRLVRLRTGGRADGTSPEAEQEAITAAVVQHVRQQRQPLVERFAGALARQQEGVDGRAAVVDALRRGQVEELLLHDDPGSEAMLWAGEEPLQIGVSREDAVTAGAREPRKEPADAVLVWAAVSSGAGVTMLDPDDPQLTEGSGALLRWSDPSTPHVGAPSMPGHGQGPGSAAR